jgi:hypothetical protein
LLAEGVGMRSIMNASKTLTAWVLLPALILALSLLPSKAFCQTKVDYLILTKFTTTFLAHTRDFIDFNESCENDTEYAIGMSFINIAQTYSDHSDFIAEEISILLGLETTTDKKLVKEVLKQRLKTTSTHFISATMKGINNNLSHTKRAVMVAQGNKLKDDLKEFQKALETISDKMAAERKAASTQPSQK